MSVNTSTVSGRRDAFIRSGRRTRRYRNNHSVSVDQSRAPRTLHIALLLLVLLPVVGVLSMASKGLGVKTWVLHHTGLAPVRKVIPLASGVADPSIQFDKVALPMTA